MTAKKKPAAKKAQDDKPKEPTPSREQLAAAVLARMEEDNGHSLREACQDSGISPSSFMRWVEDDSALAEQYARARERLLDLKAEELEEIGERASHAETAVQVAGLRLLSDNRKWLLSKLAPKKYGEKVAIGGAHDLPPVQSVHALDENTLLQIAGRGRS